jgi:hypothetical protein
MRARLRRLSCDAILLFWHSRLGELGSWLLFLSIASSSALGQGPVGPSDDQLRADAPTGRLRLTLPLLDLPFNAEHGVAFPSMWQSMAITTDFYVASHFGIQRAWGEGRVRRWLARGTIVLFDVCFLALPLAGAWLHEEFHRAVMSRRGIESFNEVYNLDLTATVIKVSHVRDEDLVRFKREHPAEFVRMSAAGLEGEYLLAQELEKGHFFRRSAGWHLPVYWGAKLASAIYVHSSLDPAGDAWTDERNRRETNPMDRDFTGHDIRAWAYDLHRPHERYEARGVHPTGVGIDRYIKLSDLTPAEIRFLRRQRRLQLLNFVDPNLIGMGGVTLANPLTGRKTRVNLSLGHVLTPFGYTVDANVFLSEASADLFIVLHRYTNGERSFPGIDAQLLRRPLTVRGHAFELSPRIALWVQPRAQRFQTAEGALGGLASLEASAPLGQRFGWSVAVEAKTPGWVAGNVQLDAGVSLRIGGSVSLGR